MENFSTTHSSLLRLYCVCACINSSHCCRQAHSSWHTQKVMPRLDKTSTGRQPSSLASPATCHLPLVRHFALLSPAAADQQADAVDKRYVPLSPYNHEHGFSISWLESHRQNGDDRLGTRQMEQQKAEWEQEKVTVDSGHAFISSYLYCMRLLLLSLLLLVYCASRAYRAVPIKRNPTEPGDLVNFRKCYWLCVDSLSLSFSTQVEWARL